MTILIDQCIPRKYLRLLKQWGYDAQLVQSHISPDSPDADVIHLAQELDAVLLKDMGFANVLVYPPQNYQGIVVLRYQPEDEQAVTRVLRQALQDLYRDSLRSVLVIVNPRRYRIRRATE